MIRREPFACADKMNPGNKGGTMASQPKPAEELSIWNDARKMIDKARKDGVETVWDRFEQ